MLRKTLPAAFLACLALLLLDLRRAQSDQPQEAPSHAGAPTLFDLSFKGGTVDEYIRAVRAAAREANIIVMPEAAPAYMPPVDLKSVTVEAAVYLLNHRLDPRDSAISELSVNRTGTSAAGESEIFTISAASRPGRNSLKPVDSQVWSVADLVSERMPAEAVLTAIQTALDLLGQEYPEAQMRFHKDTGLVIARGHPEQMAVIAQIVDQLRTTLARQNEDPFRRLQSETNNLRAELNKSNGDAVTLRDALDMCRQEITVLATVRTQLQDENARLRDENAQLLSRINGLEANLRSLRTDLNKRNP